MTDNPQKLWFVLIGAMIASRDVRTEATSKIPLDDVPSEVADLWKGLESGDPQAVRQLFRGMKVDVWNDGVIPSLTRHLQEQAMGSLCQRLMSRAQVTSLQKPEELRDKFVKMASLMDSRIEALEKSRVDGREAAKRAEAKPGEKSQNGG